jgi:hypothetical protein
MSSLMLVNPRKRRKARSPAQKAATRRMIAARRPKRAAAKRRHNPIAIHRKRPVRHAAARHVRRAKRRHNPIGISAGGITSLLMNGLKGAGGAVLVNVVTNYLPDVVKQGKMVYVTRAALAIAMGTFGRKLLGNNARVMAEGAMVVNLHDAINSFAGAMIPGSQMHGMNEYISSGGMNGIGETMPRFDSELSGMQEYIPA